VRNSACEATEWQSSSIIVCKISRGVALSGPITATIIREEGPNDRIPFLLETGIAFSFDKVQLGEISEINGPASGGQVLTFSGSNFGTFDMTVKNALGYTSCESSFWQSNTAVTCKNSPGILAYRGIVISLAMGRDTISECFTYDIHKPLTIFPTNSITFGTGTVTITGFGFGATDYSPAVSIRTSNIPGGTACMATRWQSDSIVLCKLPADTHSELNVVVTVNRIRQTMDRVFSYNMPKVTAIRPSNLPNSGNIRVTIEGANFGASSYNARAARLGDTACTETTWFSDTSMSCRGERGYSENLNVITTVAALLDVRRLLSYDAPRVTALKPYNGPASGNVYFVF
jgi:hypothetical protein